MAEQLDEEQADALGEFELRPLDAIEAPLVHLTREGLHRLEDELGTLTKVRVQETVARIAEPARWRQPSSHPQDQPVAWSDSRPCEP